MAAKDTKTIIWRKAVSAEGAATLESAFHELGCDGMEREKDA